MLISWQKEFARQKFDVITEGQASFVMFCENLELCKDSKCKEKLKGNEECTSKKEKRKTAMNLIQFKI